MKVRKVRKSKPKNFVSIRCPSSSTATPPPETSNHQQQPTSSRRRLIVNVKDEHGLADKPLIPGRLLKAKPGVIELDADGAVLGGGEALAVGEPVHLVEANSGRSDKLERGRVGLASGTSHGGGGDHVVALHKGGNTRLWQRDIADERGDSVDGATADGVRYAEVERAEGLAGDGELGEEAVKCDLHGPVVGTEDRADGGRVAPIASGNDLACEHDTLSQCGGGEKKSGDAEELHLEDLRPRVVLLLMLETRGIPNRKITTISAAFEACPLYSYASHDL
ncbi:hypothetical protein QC764_0062470 [Podospora pseudoanserina]|uniref:Uncharacterized protein n=1 Tax=Podospora pseudoanserina TaxID=2609844 RepID=A0ABR0I8D3_9PEZI|nr:hypothetical protein QC764_0062470 [Podospora pseudoanserina]